MTKIKGIDVSHWQGTIDWEKVRADGVEFAFIKASEGKTYVDRRFKENVAGANSAGVQTGAYHYAKFGSVKEAKEEAYHFLKTVAGLKLTYPLVLDLEENRKGLSRPSLTGAAIAFLEELKNTGNSAILYSGKSFLENNLDESRLKTHPLWVARYNHELGRHADIWQYTSKGKVNGIAGHVDLNYAYRDFKRNAAPASASITQQAPVPEGIEKPETYIVKTGDSLSVIANRFGTTVKALVQLNAMPNPDIIHAGQKIRVK